MGIRLEGARRLQKRKALQRHGAIGMALPVPGHPRQQTFRYSVPPRSHHGSRHWPFGENRSDMAQDAQGQGLYLDRENGAILNNPHQQVATDLALTRPLSTAAAPGEAWSELVPLLALSRSDFGGYASDESLTSVNLARYNLRRGRHSLRKNDFSKYSTALRHTSIRSASSHLPVRKNGHGQIHSARDIDAQRSGKRPRLRFA